MISEKNLQKYIKLFKDMDFPHKPDLIGVCILDFDKKGMAELVDLNKFDFSEETKKILRTDFSIETFLKKFVHLVAIKT